MVKSDGVGKVPVGAVTAYFLWSVCGGVTSHFLPDTEEQNKLHFSKTNSHRNPDTVLVDGFKECVIHVVFAT